MAKQNVALNSDLYQKTLNVFSEVKSALKDGKITLDEGFKIALKLLQLGWDILCLVSAFKKKEV